MLKLQLKSKNPKGHISISSFDIFSNISSLEPFRVRGMLGKWLLVKCIINEFLTDFDFKNKAISKLSFLETYLCPLP